MSKGKSKGKSKNKNTGRRKTKKNNTKYKKQRGGADESADPADLGIDYEQLRADLSWADDRIEVLQDENDQLSGDMEDREGKIVKLGLEIAALAEKNADMEEQVRLANAKQAKAEDILAEYNGAAVRLVKDQGEVKTGANEVDVREAEQRWRGHELEEQRQFYAREQAAWQIEGDALRGEIQELKGDEKNFLQKIRELNTENSVFVRNFFESYFKEAWEVVLEHSNYEAEKDIEIKAAEEAAAAGNSAPRPAQKLDLHEWVDIHHVEYGPDLKHDLLDMVNECLTMTKENIGELKAEVAECREAGEAGKAELQAAQDQLAVRPTLRSKEKLESQIEVLTELNSKLQRVNRDLTQGESDLKEEIKSLRAKVPRLVTSEMEVHRLANQVPDSPPDPSLLEMDQGGMSLLDQLAGDEGALHDELHAMEARKAQLQREIEEMEADKLKAMGAKARENSASWADYHGENLSEQELEKLKAWRKGQAASIKRSREAVDRISGELETKKSEMAEERRQFKFQIDKQVDIQRREVAAAADRAKEASAATQRALGQLKEASAETLVATREKNALRAQLEQVQAAAAAAAAAMDAKAQEMEKQLDQERAKIDYLVSGIKDRNDALLRKIQLAEGNA